MTTVDRLPHYVTYRDGFTWTDSPTFNNLTEAEDWARGEFTEEAIADGLVAFVPVIDPDEERR